ncbi:MAG: Mn transporter [Parcubacteria group bacterium GW2011_GWA1_42_7]|nr:MAG: Mn transporter [Parcubacteria group bacterium GW2011_GWB1_42_6]KKS69880.1 MAG: Mn transporter [Parcubacteria group bacterium GW2011_GWA1_42_7]KKS92251.1 MAG: Mn transporter [Parcubacteria group bacterium GW2011_GWC1_43_12]
MFRHFLKPVQKFRKSYLPGIVTAGADEDPSSISTFSIIGATTGLSALWLIFISTPLLIVVHRLSAMIGDVTKKGLMTLIKENFGKKTAFFFLAALVLANLLLLFANIVGMAAGFELLTGSNYIYFIIPVIIIIWFLMVFEKYKQISKYFFWFSAILACYVISGFLSNPNWGEVFGSVVFPDIKFNLAYISAAIALLGAVFTPYTFFWQTREEIEEHHNVKNLNQSNRSVIFGFIYSGIITFFIILTSASTIASGEINNLTMEQISNALAPLAGGWASVLFAVGLIGSGILSIPILISTSAYAVAEYFNWPDGLNKKPSRAKGFYSVITLGFIICLLALALDVMPVKLIFYSQILVGLLAPISIYFITRIASSKKIMGRYRCHYLSVVLGWLTILFLVAGDLLFIGQIIF